MGGYAIAGFLSGPGVAIAATVVFAGALIGKRAMVVVLVLQSVGVASIAWLVTDGRLPAPTSESLDPARMTVWLRTMSVSLLVLILLAAGVWGVVRDMDEAIVRAESETHRRQRAERMRADAERKALDTRHLETIGRLASGVAHDFNNNLTAIIGMTELLQSDVDLRPSQREMISHILEASLNSAELTKQLLAYSRKARVQPVPTEIEALVSTSIELVRPSLHPNIQVSTEFRAPSARVSADPGLLQSAIMNLLINARDAMQDGGKLTIRTRVEGVTEEGTGSASVVVLDVADTGCGMAPEVLSRAFDPFFTTKPPGQGTGLGLSAVAGTVESHGGKIGVASTVGAGTTFQLRLPLISESQLPVGAEDSALPSSSADILVVDDEASVRHAAGTLLSSLGYKVTLAEDGDHAIRLAQSSSKPFELVVLDSKMPGLSREATFRSVRGLWPDVPVLFWSGRAADDALEQLLGHQRTSFIQKPYRAADLAQRVHDLISGRPDRPPL
jgi:signal transduction histidine kinase/CheY-like chemotaxis protein